MIYAVDITTPANTAKSDRLRWTLRVTKGLVYKIAVDFPSGAAGLHHIIVCDGHFQVWPSTPGLTFHADDRLIEFDDTYLKETAPFEFTLYSWNLDDTFEHVAQVRVGVVSSEIFMARFLPTYGYKNLKALIDAMLQEQEALREETLRKPFSWME